MKITLKLNNRTETETLAINMTMNAARIYRQTVSRDLLKDMHEIYWKVNRSAFEGVDLTKIDTSKSEAEITAEILKQADLTILSESKKDLDYDETERGCMVLWAFTKNADVKTIEFEEWIGSFDYVLPIAEIITALYEAWHKTVVPTVELKN